MKRIATGALLLGLLLAGACERSHARNSSGSNWLRCDTLADCRVVEDAVACSDDRFCVDGRGERIAVPADGGAREPTSQPAPDAGDAEPRDASVPEPCAWGVDGLLAEVGVPAARRANCGELSGAESEAATAARGCFENAVRDGTPVQVTINRCSDCLIPTTFVATASGQRFAVLMERDYFGDRLREAKVEACDDVVFVEGSEVLDVSCVAPTVLYTCTEPLDAPLSPYKVADIPLPLGEVGVPLHLSVSNQSFEQPLAEIDVIIDDTHVVTGDFDVADQHNWHEFEITVPPGTRTVRAFMQQGSATLEQQIEVPTERWAVLDYWYYPGEPEGEHFTLQVQDEPVSFQ